MSHSTHSPPIRPHVSDLDHARLLGATAGHDAALDAIANGSWRYAPASWSPWDRWFLDAARDAARRLPQTVETALAWFDAMRSAWNAAGQHARPRVPSIPTSPVWRAV